MALAAPAHAWPEAERRHVCILFCDLVGSTPMSQQLDAEDLRTALGSYQHVCKVVVNTGVLFFKRNGKSQDLLLVQAFE